MKALSYLPSAQFVTLVVSLGLSAGLVWIADRVTNPVLKQAAVEVAPTPHTFQEDWQKSLIAVQGTSTLPSGMNPSIVEGLRQGATTDNLTDTIGKTLFVNLTDVKSQGLGNDIPTQDKLVASAAQQLQKTFQARTYTEADFSVVSDTPTTRHTYGNMLAEIILRHARVQAADRTLWAVSVAVDTGETASLKELPVLEKDYATLIEELLDIPTPQTLRPFHVALTNAFSRIAASYTLMQTITKDPLKGLTGLQQFQQGNKDMLTVLTNIAQNMTRGDILWKKDEPGAAWGSFLSGE